MNRENTMGKLFFIISCGLVIAAGCGSSGGGYGGGGGGGGCTLASATSATAVTIADFSFTPSCVKVAQNTIVTWTNNGPTAHTVTSDPGAPENLASGNLTAGQTFTHTFVASGTSTGYHCSIHPGMTATVFVQ